MTVRVEHRQRDHAVRLEWGAEGAALLAAECAVVGCGADVDLAAAHDVSTAAPRRRAGLLA